MPDYQNHASIFGKSCFNCSSCCVDTEPEDAYTTYWCQKDKRILMKKIAVLNSICSDWAVEKEPS